MPNEETTAAAETPKPARTRNTAKKADEPASLDLALQVAHLNDRIEKLEKRFAKHSHSVMGLQE